MMLPCSGGTAPQSEPFQVLPDESALPGMDGGPATSPAALFFGDPCSEDTPNLIKNNIDIKYLNYSAKKMHFGIDIAGGGACIMTYTDS